MVDHIPAHSLLVAAVIGAGALWLIASQIAGLFVG